MISTDELKKYTCHILPETGSGTGIFVGADLILTCKHVVQGLAKGDKVSVTGFGGNEFEAHLKDYYDEGDLALLITKDFSSKEVAILCDCENIVGTPWACHGHPDTRDGKDVGSPLRGLFIDNILDSSSTTHDLSLSAEGQSLNATFKGFSGSAVINELGHVTAILRYKNTSYLNGVSIRKASNFLKNHGVLVREDELSDFTEYIAEAFSSFEDGIRDICLAKGAKVLKVLSPQSIVDTLKGTLFYPSEKGTTKDVITKLRKNGGNNKVLWIGWIKFLTYVAIIKGAYEDVNKITIELDSTHLSHILNVELTPMTVPLTLSLNFFFTENERFFSITSEYIIKRWLDEDMSDNSCHIFNSPHVDFGHQSLTAERKQKIIADITSPMDAGFIVPGKIDFGVISLNELTRAIATGQNIADASKNLENLFRNALK